MNIAYVRPLFPKLSETFLLEEALQLVRLGHRVRIYAVRAELDSLQRKIVESNILDEVEYVPLRLGLYQRARYLLIFGYRFVSSRKFRRHLFTAIPVRSASRSAAAAGGGRPPGKPASFLRLLVQIGNISLTRHQPTVVARTFVPDVIYCPSLFRLGGRLLRNLQRRYPGVPHVIALRARDLYERSGRGVASTQGPWKEEAISKAARLVTISRENRDIIAQRYPHRTDVPIVHSGIDVEHFCPRGPRQPEPDLIVSVARLVAKKGLHHLFDACALLRDSGNPVRCVIAGNGPERRRLEARIAELGLREYVTLLGSATSDQVRDLLTRAAIFVLPCVIAQSGDRDILPNSVKEAMAMKVPVITSRIAGIDELIEDGASGLLVPPGDAAALAGAINRLRGDAALAARLGESGRARVCADFAATSEAKKLAAVLADVVRRPAPVRVPAVVGA